MLVAVVASCMEEFEAWCRDLGLVHGRDPSTVTWRKYTARGSIAELYRPVLLDGSGADWRHWRFRPNKVVILTGALVQLTPMEIADLKNLRDVTFI